MTADKKSSATSFAFDREAFLANFQGMDSLANEIIASFHRELPQQIVAIELAIKSKNSAELEMAAHTLKGVVLNFCAKPSILLAAKLEEMGHNKVFENAEENFKELKIALDKLSKELNSWRPI
ncbi:MAG: Hpt domain-containing protein [Pseudomonadota bacterium]|nr:Hpt domain-containing protein [Pseudomonadota bacterium]